MSESEIKEFEAEFKKYCEDKGIGKISFSLAPNGATLEKTIEDIRAFMRAGEEKFTLLFDTNKGAKATEQILIKESEDYLAIKVPKDSLDHDIHVPYHNNISYSINDKSNPGWAIVKFIEVPQIKPNSKERYKMLGFISNLTNAEIFKTGLLLEIPPYEWEEWVIIQKK